MPNSQLLCFSVRIYFVAAPKSLPALNKTRRARTRAANYLARLRFSFIGLAFMWYSWVALRVHPSLSRDTLANSSKTGEQGPKIGRFVFPTKSHLVFVFLTVSKIGRRSSTGSKISRYVRQGSKSVDLFFRQGAIRRFCWASIYWALSWI